MYFEVYVRDGELFDIFEDIFGLFHKYLVFIQGTHTHVVLEKEEKARETQHFATSGLKELDPEKRTSTPGKVDAPRHVLDSTTPAD
jgi:hypothetical protein